MMAMNTKLSYIAPEVHFVALETEQCCLTSSANETLNDMYDNTIYDEIF